jgi:hypothetical protein
MTMTALSPPNHRAGNAQLPTSHRSIVAQAFRYLGALAVLATGIAHIEQYSVDGYSTVPTIGTLFLLNFIAAIVIAIGLIAPLQRATERHTDAVRAVLAVGGIGLGVGSLAGLFISETSGLFGFTEHGYRMAIVVAIAVEVAATLFLAAFLVANGTGRQKPARVRDEPPAAYASSDPASDYRPALTSGARRSGRDRFGERLSSGPRRSVAGHSHDPSPGEARGEASGLQSIIAMHERSGEQGDAHSSL